MGFDIAVCFLKNVVEVDVITQALPQNGVCYLSYWQTSPISPDISHFVLWEEIEESINLIEVCKEISRTTSPLYIGWKSEHGGIGGYSIIERGVLAEHTYSETNYVYLAIEGFQKAFGHRPVEEGDEHSFPEIALETPTEMCFIIKMGTASQIPNDIITQLIEGDGNAEPVFP